MPLEQPAYASQPVFSRTGERAFTLVEILITAGIIIVVGATAMYALSMINKYAASARVQAAGAAIVQHQIDQILTRGPYVPTNSPPDIPAILISGTTVTNNVPVFVDPESGNVLVSGTLTTTIQDSGATYKSAPLYVLKAAVILNYTFAGKPFAIAMDTLRAPDQ
jgi:type II secretory pathway pseudopilin PulG